MLDDMRIGIATIVLLALAPVAAADPPAGHTEWADALKPHYAHAKSAKVATSTKQLHLGLCGKGKAAPVIDLEPGFATMTLRFSDENLFQDSWIEIARVKPGVDVVGIVAGAPKACTADKRYQVVVQAGDAVFLYHARCSQMRTPFYYDVGDLIAAIESTGAVVGEKIIMNHCGAFDHKVATVADAKVQAQKPRRLYKHRFPGAREAARAKAKATGSP